MATNDGYSPYPLNLTALQVKDAITRAHNLSQEFSGYVAYTDSLTPPTLLGGIKEGDIWHNPQTGVYYRAFVDTVNPLTPVLMYFEV